jgi:hypothetical protein
MSRDDLDRTLRDDSIEPSSGFALRVMDAVRAVADAPPPLAFPWGRLALGVASCVAFSGAATLLAPEAVASWNSVALALAPLADIAPLLGRSAAALTFAIAVSRLPRLFVRS